MTIVSLVILAVATFYNLKTAETVVCISKLAGAHLPKCQQMQNHSLLPNWRSMWGYRQQSTH